MDALWFARILVCAFFAVCFLQSSLDKITDWKGNMEWLTGHFSKTPFRNAVAPMLGMITLLELATGVTCAIAVVMLVLRSGLLVPTAGMTLACVSLLSLFAGQRIARDYVGAATLATYFAVALFGLFLMSQGNTVVGVL